MQKIDDHEYGEEWEAMKKDFEAAMRHNEQQHVLRVKNQITDSELYTGFRILLSKLREQKPDERNERARRYAVTITELEKAAAYFKTYVVDNG